MSSYLDAHDAAWVSQFLASRRSTRDFLPTPVPQEIIDQILIDALTAPSWSNTRPFKVALQPERLKIELVMSFYLGGVCCRRSCAKDLKTNFA